jgi:hypothetical protein
VRPRYQPLASTLPGDSRLVILQLASVPPGFVSKAYMASYRSPGPINDLSPQPLVIDNGTLAHTETAAPGSDRTRQHGPRGQDPRPVARKPSAGLCTRPDRAARRQRGVR